jgi:hypothetical protein
MCCHVQEEAEAAAVKAVRAEPRASGAEVRVRKQVREQELVRIGFKA